MKWNSSRNTISSRLRSRKKLLRKLVGNTRKEWQAMNGSYYAVIPAKVLHDKDLLKYPKSILLYGHIANLANQKGYCWATNKYFMEQLGVKSATTITDYLNLLVRKGFIKKKKIYKDGTKQIEKRIISIDTGTPMPPDCNTSTPADCNSPIPPDCKENNTSINNTSINSVDDNQQSNNSKPNGKKISDNDYITQSLSLIQENYFNQITPIKLESLTTEIEQLGENAAEIISVAIDYTKEKGKNLNYLTKVINNWADDNVTTVEQAQEKINGKPSKFKNDWIEQALKELEND